MTTQTTADRRAADVAEQFRAAGWEVSVTTRDVGPGFFPEGGQLFSGRHYAWVSATRDLWADGVVRHIHARWSTVVRPLPGQRRMTTFCLVSATCPYPGQDVTIRSRAKAYALFSSLISDSERRKAESTVTS